jgi:hypothetical protein
MRLQIKATDYEGVCGDVAGGAAPCTGGAEKPQALERGGCPPAK